MKSFGEKFWTTSHLQNTLLRFHSNNLLTYQINPRAVFYFQHTVRRSSLCRKEEPPTKCKKCEQTDSELRWKPALSLCRKTRASSQVLLGKTEPWRLSQKCPHKPQPPDSWRRNGRTCPGTVGCQFSLQHPFQNAFVPNFLSLRSDGFKFH